MKITFLILTAIASFLIGGTLVKNSLTKELKAYHRYYQQTETLLDSLYDQDPNKFEDIISETDAYINYEITWDSLHQYKISQL